MARVKKRSVLDEPVLRETTREGEKRGWAIKPRLMTLGRFGCLSASHGVSKSDHHDADRNTDVPVLRGERDST